MDDCLERTESMVSMTKLKSASEEEDRREQAALQAPADSANGGGLIDQLISHLPGLEPNASATGELKNDTVCVEKCKEEEHKERGVESNTNVTRLMNQIVSNMPSVSVPVSSPGSLSLSSLNFLAQIYSIFYILM